MLAKYRSWFLLVFDLFVVVSSYYIALWLRLDMSLTDLSFFIALTKIVPIILIINFIFLKIFKVDKTLWRQNSVPEALQVALALFCGYLVSAILIMFVIEASIPRSVHIIAMLLGILAAEFSRFIYRIYRYYQSMSLSENPENKKTLIIGSGDAGLLLHKEIMNNPRYNNNVIGFIDDNENKIGKLIGGTKILGTSDNLKQIVEQYEIELVYIAIPSASVQTQNELVKKCHELNVEVKILGQSENMLSDYDVKKNIRSISIIDLLGRKQIELNNSEIEGLVKNKTVMVTGAAGSIGSELCRQLLKFHPSCLLMIDINENALYELQQDFIIQQREGRIQKDILLKSLIVSIRDEVMLEQVMSEYLPSIIFHAAAHKHVPFMEDTPLEAIKNNIFGTYNLIQLAKKYQVKNFVSISTDKAVNPTNVMGATKRFVEKMIQAFGKDSPTKFVAVRFGNVLGSNGSVVPLFQKQIEKGGPVTVTDKNMVRYFMTIPEAVSLVIQAATFGKGGELFVLDMGEPVKILDLAEKMIELAGYVPYRDIDIKITGLRPGEKLYEELLMSEEGLRPTPNNLIFVARPMDISADQVNDELKLLADVVTSPHDNKEIISYLQRVVDTYKPNPVK